jgi:hypothetical protein
LRHGNRRQVDDEDLRELMKENGIDDLQREPILLKRFLDANIVRNKKKFCPHQRVFSLLIRFKMI